MISLKGIGEVEILETKFYLGYKVVTEEMKSLGLRNNPNIYTYELGVWKSVPKEELLPDCSDRGGIWVARSFSQAKGLVRYMKEKHDQSSRIFKAALRDILFYNNYRVKTSAVFLFEETNIKQPL